jgi:hypothetical protein
MLIGFARANWIFEALSVRTPCQNYFQYVLHKQLPRQVQIPIVTPDRDIRAASMQYEMVIYVLAGRLITSSTQSKWSTDKVHSWKDNFVLS